MFTYQNIISKTRYSRIKMKIENRKPVYKIKGNTEISQKHIKYRNNLFRCETSEIIMK